MISSHAQRGTGRRARRSRAASRPGSRRASASPWGSRNIGSALPWITSVGTASSPRRSRGRSSPSTSHGWRRWRGCASGRRRRPSSSRIAGSSSPRVPAYGRSALQPVLRCRLAVAPVRLGRRATRRPPSARPTSRQPRAHRARRHQRDAQHALRWWTAGICASAPPLEMPTRCARSTPTRSSTRSTSAAESSPV